MALLGLAGIWGTVVYIIAILCAIWVIYDVWAVNKKLSDLAKIIWTVFAIVLSIITAIVYWFVEKR